MKTKYCPDESNLVKWDLQSYLAALLLSLQAEGALTMFSGQVCGYPTIIHGALNYSCSSKVAF